MEKKEEKKIFINPVVKRFYAIYDSIAEDFSELWFSQNNASALRCFKHTISSQLKVGAITDSDDYKLFYICDLVTYPGGKIEVIQHATEVIDNEANNASDEKTEVTINHV